MEFKRRLDTRTREVERILCSFLPEEKGYQRTVIEAMNYSVLVGGKRLRPLFMSETYRLFGGGDMEVVAPFMAAIEMIHTYSLVHDDLPAMDNDEYRRGKRTTHAVFGEAMGILAGDALLNYAYETATKAFDTGCGEERTARAIRILMRKSGIYGMIGGQVVDIESEHETAADLEKIKFIHRMKTSALIEASMVIGAVLAGADREETAQMERLAERIGLAFQIRDDILDVTGTMEVLGKPIHSDERNKKATYVTAVGLEQAILDVERYSREAISLLSGLNRKNEFLEELIVYLIHRKS